MSVRMALAKLSAFAAGGALIGGGAVHVADQVQAKRDFAAKPTVKRTSVKHRAVRRTVAYQRPSACLPVGGSSYRSTTVHAGADYGAHGGATTTYGRMMVGSGSARRSVRSTPSWGTPAAPSPRRCCAS